MSAAITPKQFDEMKLDLLTHASEYIGLSIQLTGTGECTLLGGLIEPNYVGLVTFSMTDQDEMRELLVGVDKYIKRHMKAKAKERTNAAH